VTGEWVREGRKDEEWRQRKGRRGEGIEVEREGKKNERNGMMGEGDSEKQILD
jgi:hypothetical protein